MTVKMDTKPKPFVFVLMPFDSVFSDVYELGIKAACAKAGTYAQRLDEQIFTESMLQRIYNQIAKADVIVADMTGRNPNVFYEVGYAHALGKQVVLLTQDSADIPFDLKHYPHIVYKGRISGLIPDLEARVRWAVENAEQSTEVSVSNLQLFIGGVPLIDNPRIRIKTRPDGEVNLGVDVHNSPTKAIRELDLSFYVVTSDYFTSRDRDNDSGTGGYSKGGERHQPGHIPTTEIEMPDQTRVHVLNKNLKIPPGGWDKFKFRLYPDHRSARDFRKPHQISVRACSASAVQDFPFLLDRFRGGN